MNPGVPADVVSLLAASASVVVSVSGGKDSAATALWLTDLGIPHERVFCDTGWEHPSTYDYISGPLTQKLGEIKVLRHNHQWPSSIRLPLLRAEGVPKEEITQAETELASVFAPIMETAAQEVEAVLGWRSDFVRMAISETVFPSRIQRWCTRHLKFRPVKSYLQTKENPVNVVGSTSSAG